MGGELLVAYLYVVGIIFLSTYWWESGAVTCVEYSA